MHDPEEFHRKHRSFASGDAAYSTRIVISHVQLVQQRVGEDDDHAEAIKQVVRVAQWTLRTGTAKKYPAPRSVRIYVGVA